MAPSRRHDDSSISANETSALALAGLLTKAERGGYVLAPDVFDAVQSLASRLFSFQRDPPRAIRFSGILKDIAIRLFRQRRYRDAHAHYELASRFNPPDPTLISNRATCMYNLARFTDCIGVCKECLEKFPTLTERNPVLYFKVLLRMGRANIELGNISEAQSIFDTLYKLRTSSDRSTVSQQSVSNEPFDQLLSPFAKHLKAKREYHENHPEAAAAASVNSQDDCEQADTNNSYETIHLADVCPHISEHGLGKCRHPFVQPVDQEVCSCPPGSHVGDHNCLANLFNPSGRLSIHPLGPIFHSSRDDARNAGKAGKEGNEKGLLSKKVDKVRPEDGANSVNDNLIDDATEEAIDITQPRNDINLAQLLSTKSFPSTSMGRKRGSELLSRAANLKRTSGVSSSVSGQSASSSQLKGNTPLDWTNAFRTAQKKKVISPKAAQRSQTNASSLGGTISTANKASASCLKSNHVESGFKRGFLESNSSLFPSEIGPSNNNSNYALGSASSEDHCVACYESDIEKDNAPLTAGLMAERGVEDNQLLEIEKKLPSSNTRKTSEVLISVLDEVLGKSFNMTRTIDFTRIFGHHVSSPGTGKRKRKSCVANCGTCFARKMWRIRFTCTDSNEAKDALNVVDNDPRQNADTFLPIEGWEMTGYYGSGYELAFDVPALVHGVAYICHLQSELHWRGDKVPLLKDIQNSFVTSLERNVSATSNMRFLFMIFFMLRDTVKLFALFPDTPSAEDARSFQFSHTASTTARSALSLPVSTAAEDTSRYQLLQSSKTESLTRNMYNWSLLGQMAREEKWMYNFLLRDVSHLILSLTNSVSRPPSYLEAGETFSEAFKKACGERANDDSYWKCRIVTIVERDRCRMIERIGGEAQADCDLQQGVLLYSSAIGCRPQQPRLLFRRAQIRGSQRKWAECVDDIRKAVAIIKACRNFMVSGSSCPAPHKCLLIDLHSLEGDVLIERSQEAGDDSLESVSAALKAYREAIAYVSEESMLYSDLSSKVIAASRKIDTLTFDAGNLKNSKKKNLEKVKNDKEPVKGDSRTEAKSTKVQIHEPAVSVIDEGPSSAKEGSSADHSSRKERNPYTSQPSSSISPGPSASATSETESSSEEDDFTSSLVGNPYAALIDGEIPTLSSVTSGPKPIAAKTSKKPVVNGYGNKLITGNVRSSSQGLVSADFKNVSKAETRKNRQSSVGPASSASPPQCSLCRVSFGGRADYESHMRGKRHRTAMAKEKASGICGNVKFIQEVSRIRSSSSSPGRASSSGTTNDECSHGRGPTREEALAEAERAMAILGGEARPCDVVSRMNFSKWNIQDVNSYLETEFGGLLALCQTRSEVFELRQGSESRPVLMLINRVRNPRSRRRVHTAHRRSALGTVQSGPIPPPIVPHQQATSHFLVDESEFPALDSHRREGVPLHLERMTNDLLNVSDDQADMHEGSSNSKIPIQGVKPSSMRTAKERESDACGICYDKKPNVRCMPCRHEWCEDCIMDNIKRGRMECPMCMGRVSHLESLADDLD